jgi:hypothetical protein
MLRLRLVAAVGAAEPGGDGSGAVALAAVGVTAASVVLYVVALLRSPRGSRLLRTVALLLGAVSSPPPQHVLEGGESANPPPMVVLPNGWRRSSNGEIGRRLHRSERRVTAEVAALGSGAVRVRAPYAVARPDALAGLIRRICADATRKQRVGERPPSQWQARGNIKRLLGYPL